MRVLIDLCHPAHVHFFRFPVEILRSERHEVIVTSRDKDVTFDLLESLDWRHIALSTAPSSKLGLFGELVQRNRRLIGVIRHLRPSVLAAIGGTFVAHSGFLTRTPSVVFYDTENAKAQNLITYPFARKVVAPACYQAWLPAGSVRYAGYHELSYLHPDRFSPNASVAVRNGVQHGKLNVLIRLVSWSANHDLGEVGWSTEMVRSLVKHFAARGNVIISSEQTLPGDLVPFLYSGNPEDIHHVMAYCSLVVGESATMASEAAALGVPAVYVAHTSRGYIDELEQKYGLVRKESTLTAGAIIQACEEMLRTGKDDISARHRHMLEQSVDVARFVADTIVEASTPKESQL